MACDTILAIPVPVNNSLINAALLWHRKVIQHHWYSFVLQMAQIWLNPATRSVLIDSPMPNGCTYNSSLIQKSTRSCFVVWGFSLTWVSRNINIMPTISRTTMLPLIFLDIGALTAADNRYSFCLH